MDGMEEKQARKAKASCMSRAEDWSLRREFFLASKLIYGHISNQFDWMTRHGQTWQAGRSREPGQAPA